ncbi:acetate/propionate family kinase [Paucilactobacillus sp. N302-9]
MSKTIAINAGSSTLKFKLFEIPSEQVLSSGLIEKIGFDDAIVTIKYGDGQKFNETVPVKDHEVAVNILLKELIDLKIISDFSEITGIGHRIVAGGEYFKDSVLIDDDVLAKIDELADYAPLHNPANAMGVRAFRKILPDVPSVAVFDTSFHTTMPEENFLYSVPYEWYEKYGARKYGAHGTSHRYISGRAAEMLGKPLSELKLITLHLGAGASITAVKDGKSYDTSMGFTPLAGLTMATRSGDIDASMVAWLEDKLGISSDEMIDILNHKSGLVGISGVSSDMRDLEKVKDTNHRAQLALDIWSNRVIRYVGQYLAEMNGADAIVFTAGVGENDINLRQEITDNLSFFGIKVDPEKNNVRGEERDISADDAKIKTLLIPTDEELMIARDVERLKNK